MSLKALQQEPSTMTLGSKNRNTNLVTIILTAQI
jgi:hypothetical protein